jgi:hypothetical protein
MPGKVTVLTAENFTLTTTILNLALISTAAAGSAAARVKIRRVEIGQSGTTTLQQIRGAFSTQTGTTVTATATTPVTVSPLGGPASGLTGNTSPFGGTARTGTNASVNTTPGYTNHHLFAFANLNGYLWKPDPTEELEIPASTLWSVRLIADPTTLTGWTVSVTIEEA